MGRFIAGIKGTRGGATRLGSHESGINAYANGWNTGVRIHGKVDEEGRDVFRVFRTGGSNGRTPQRLIAIVREGDEGDTR